MYSNERFLDFMADRGSPLRYCPTLPGSDHNRPLDLFKFYNLVQLYGSGRGSDNCAEKAWNDISELMGVKIQSEAVDKSIQDIIKQKSYLETFYKEKKNCNHTPEQRHNHLLRLLCLENKYSLVAYPVAYHYDTFDSGQASLENKICFSFKSKHRNDCGRGGDGNGRFVFAILDWTNKPEKLSNRRKIAISQC